MANSSTIVLQGGTLLIHDENKRVVPTIGDMLVEGSVISKIAPTIEAPAGARVIDCRGKIVSPGFIDTHHHLWQAQLKGRHADQTLVEYMASGNSLGVLFSPKDLFFGQLSGALESINAGTTTVVDHAHCNNSADHPQAAIQALVSAGLRTVYCYAPTRKLVSREPFKVEDIFFSLECLDTYQALARAGPFGNGRVHMGYAMDMIYAPGEVLKPFYAGLRDPSKGRAKVITTHSLGGPMYPPGSPSSAQLLHSHGLLGPDVLLSHGCLPQEGDGALLASTGAAVSSTPNIEFQMGYSCVALREDHYDSASVGVDCHALGVAGIPGQLRMLLQGARLERGTRLTSQGQWSRKTGYDAEAVFNLGTLGGAKAAGLQDEVGRLREGYKADILVFDGTSVGMLAAATEDPVAAIVLHSEPSDIELVLVDGVVRKEAGRLVDVVAEPAPAPERSAVPPGTRLSWADVVANILESRLSLIESSKGLNFREAEDVLIDSFFMNREALLEDQQVQ